MEAAQEKVKNQILKYAEKQERVTIVEKQDGEK